MPRVRGTSNRFPQPYFSLVLSKIRGRNLPELWESLQKLLKTIAVNISTIETLQVASPPRTSPPQNLHFERSQRDMHAI